MKIRINKDDRYVPLFSVGYGECFIPEDSEDVFIKTRLGCTRNTYKCIELSEGYGYEFNELKSVRVLDCEVVVNENV